MGCFPYSTQGKIGYFSRQIYFASLLTMMQLPVVNLIKHFTIVIYDSRAV